MKIRVMSLVFGIFAVICSFGVIYNTLAVKGDVDKIFPFSVTMLLCAILSKLHQ